MWQPCLKCVSETNLFPTASDPVQHEAGEDGARLGDLQESGHGEALVETHGDVSVWKVTGSYINDVTNYLLLDEPRFVVSI